MRELRQRTAIKGMLTGDQPQSTGGTPVPPGPGMDLGGYLVTPKMLEPKPAAK